jgi:uncharacterized protein (TIGR02217 family)
MAFYEHRIAIDVNRRTRGGPGMPRTKVRTTGGQLTQVFQRSRVLNTYDFSYSMKTTADFEAVRALFYIIMGTPYQGFRVRDWHDYKLTQANSVLTFITGSTWQIYRRYTEGPSSYDRIVKKPVNGSIVVYRTRSAVVSLASATVDSTTGIATISGHAGGDTYTCTGQFDVPVTFADDTMNNVEIDGFEGNLLQAVPSIPLEELLL